MTCKTRCYKDTHTIYTVFTVFTCDCIFTRTFTWDSPKTLLHLELLNLIAVPNQTWVLLWQGMPQKQGIVAKQGMVAK